MKTIKLSSKFEVTIPKEIREALHLEAGDSLFIRTLDNGHIILKKEYPVDKEYLQALTPLLAEWSSPEDDETFAHLQNL